MNAEDTPILRRATAADAPAYIELVRGLAAFEELEPPDDAAAARLLEHAFGPRPRYELCVVQWRGELVAYAAFFETYSTFRALPSLYLEDLFVRDDARGRGIGGQMAARCCVTSRGSRWSAAATVSSGPCWIGTNAPSAFTARLARVS